MMVPYQQLPLVKLLKMEYKIKKIHKSQLKEIL